MQCCVSAAEEGAQRTGSSPHRYVNRVGEECIKQHWNKNLCWPCISKCRSVSSSVFVGCLHSVRRHIHDFSIGIHAVTGTYLNLTIYSVLCFKIPKMGVMNGMELPRTGGSALSWVHHAKRWRRPRLIARIIPASREQVDKFIVTARSRDDMGDRVSTIRECQAHLHNIETDVRLKSVS